MPGAAEGPALQGLYRDIRRELEQAGLPGAALEARELVCAGCGMSREAFFRDSFLPLTEDQERRVRDLAARHLAGEPVAYLVGEWEFYGLTLTVTPAVLIPRVDTEVLAEQAIAFLSRRGSRRVLDLCAGSGCVGLAIAAQVPESRVVLGELSAEALAVCEENIRRCGLEARVEARSLNALLPPPEDAGRFDCIVCNPPYIPDGDIADLDNSVRDFEPHMALKGGADGLDFYRAIVRDWRDILEPGGLLCFEVGIGQAEAVQGILAGAGFTDVTTLPDGQGIDRVVSGAIVEKFLQSILTEETNHGRKRQETDQNRCQSQRQGGSCPDRHEGHREDVRQRLHRWAGRKIVGGRPVSFIHFREQTGYHPFLSDAAGL